MRLAQCVTVSLACLVAASQVALVCGVCDALGGSCLNADSEGCGGVWLTGHCPGAANIKCCVPTPACDAQQGSCMDTSSDECLGSFVSGLCPGPANIKCCVNSMASWQCTQRDGMCIDANAQTCMGNWVSGLCPGPANVKCCVPRSPVTTSPQCAQTQGTCIDLDFQSCAGTIKSGLCGGGSNIKCCQPPSGIVTSPACAEQQGTCIDVGLQACSGSIRSGLCPGAADIKCCMPPAPAESPSRSEDYLALWNFMTIRVPARVNTAAQAVQAGRSRYESVSATTGIPWQVIGVIHWMEASCRFDRHMHNGDPLTARTVHVPKGLPATGSPPFTWEQSAADAFSRAINIIWRGRSAGWDIASTMLKLEAYNGFGYKTHGLNSPYLWASTNHYTKGLFVADGSWDPNAVSQRAGAAPVLKQLAYSGV